MLRVCLPRRMFLPSAVRHAATLHHSDLSTPDRDTVKSNVRKELKTPLCEEILRNIQIHGFVPIGQYMKDCLTHVNHGYYTTKKQVIGGDNADFITAAEIPFFVDVIAAWVMDCWQKMGTPRVLHLVELGPGKGTLMKGMLKQIQASNPSLFHFLQIHMIEIGAARVEEQKKALSEFQTATGKIKWWLSIESIPYCLEPMVFVANEYFDALPVSQFMYTDRGWVELCLDADVDPQKESHFKYICAPSGSFTAYLIPEEVRQQRKQIDSRIEIDFMGMQAIEFIMRKMIDCNKAACLIVDYGKDEHMESTFRGIRGHKFVDPLLSPGDIDLSAWVSFKQLRWTLERLEIARRQLKWFPVLTQSQFLEQNGIDIRLARVIKNEETKNCLRILQHYRRLMDKEEMGETYKVFAFQTKNFPCVTPFFDSMVEKVPDWVIKKQ